MSKTLRRPHGLAAKARRIAPLVLVGSSCAFTGAVTTALANHYHVNGVGHGLVHGSSTTDQAASSRVEAGGGYSTCALYDRTYNVNSPALLANGATNGGSTCNSFSNLLYNEQNAFARVSAINYFGSHDHFAH